MEVKEAYNIWAEQYDTNDNKTRDLEAISLRNMLSNITFNQCLEIGCGTGKNTEWIISRADKVLAVDLSPNMLEKAKTKVQSDWVNFVQADMSEDWFFTEGAKFDLAVFSLVLEHIKNLDSIFDKLKEVIVEDGYVYIGELHPFKQYSGSKARFETEEGLQVVKCYTHHISDFIQAAKRNGFKIAELSEFFDEGVEAPIPRILAMLFRKQESA